MFKAAAMDFKFALCFTITVVAVHGASVPQRLVSPRFSRNVQSDSGLGIYDGQKTTIEKHPYVTNLRILNGKINCSATIVSAQWVVTIATCVIGLKPEHMTLVAGSNDGASGEIYSVDKRVVHPKCANGDYNLAVVKINGKFTWSEKVKAIKLPKSEPKDNTTMIIAGYGKRSISGASNGALLQGKMKWLPHKMCDDIYRPYVRTFTDRMNCAYNPHKTTPCIGDWADAFVHQDVVYGMFVTGIDDGFCTSRAKPVLLTNVGPMAKWIQENTGALYEDEL